MKKAKAVLAALLAAGLTVGSAVPALAFYQQPQSKKGLLLSQQTADMLADIGNLGVKQVVVNMGTDQDLNTFDPLAAYCTQNGVTLTMIVINRPGAPAGMMPSAPVAGVGTYGFNVSSAEGQAAVRIYARSLAARYKNSVSNWVIGNEVNDAIHWDYNGEMDMQAHAESYAKAFRIFYEEIKAVNPEAKVLIPFDMRWKATTGEPGCYPTAEYLPLLNSKLRDTDYGIAWHPYPVHFFTKPEFQDDDGISADVNTTPNINMKNINVLTDYLQTADMRTPNGEVRPLFLTEMGFTSAVENGEARQAAAIAEAYRIAKENPYIQGMYLSRQVDAASQVAAGGAFGLWRRNESAGRDEIPASKKLAWEVYKNLQ